MIMLLGNKQGKALQELTRFASTEEIFSLITVNLNNREGHRMEITFTYYVCNIIMKHEKTFLLITVNLKCR